MTRPSHRDATAAEQHAVASALALALEPYRLMAHAIADFQSDLACADGSAYDNRSADLRLGALVMRTAAALARIYADEQPADQQPALQALAAWLERDCSAVLNSAAEQEA